MPPSTTSASPPATGSIDAHLSNFDNHKLFALLIAGSEDQAPTRSSQRRSRAALHHQRPGRRRRLPPSTSTSEPQLCAVAGSAKNASAYRTQSVWPSITTSARRPRLGRTHVAPTFLIFTTPVATGEPWRARRRVHKERQRIHNRADVDHEQRTASLRVPHANRFILRPGRDQQRARRRFHGSPGALTSSECPSGPASIAAPPAAGFQTRTVLSSDPLTSRDSPVAGS